MTELSNIRILFNKGLKVTYHLKGMQKVPVNKDNKAVFRFVN